MHNWEIVVQFAVHGQGKTLFGDGFALWYTKERGKTGPVLGNQDYFSGLGVFLDTYSNHNGEHAVTVKIIIFDACFSRTLSFVDSQKAFVCAVYVHVYML